MRVARIPLTAGPQVFTIVLGSAAYDLRLCYAASAATPAWLIDIADASGAALVSGLPVLPGADILGQHQHLGFNGALYAEITDAPDRAPAFSDMGRGLGLYFVTAS